MVGIRYFRPDFEAIQNAGFALGPQDNTAQYEAPPARPPNETKPDVNQANQANARQIEEKKVKFQANMSLRLFDFVCLYLVIFATCG